MSSSEQQQPQQAQPGRGDGGAGGGRGAGRGGTAGRGGVKMTGRVGTVSSGPYAGMKGPIAVGPNGKPFVVVPRGGGRGGAAGGAGRGGGRGGAGHGNNGGRGRGQLQQQQGRGGGPGRGIPSYLVYFNRYISVTITGYLNKEELENLGEAYPNKFKPKEPTEQQKKVMEARKKKMKEIEEKKKAEQKENGTEGDGGVEDDVNDPKKKAERLQAVKANLTDCHTLLAQLNSRRLFRRIQHYKKLYKDFNYRHSYAFGGTCEQIANLEWNKLILDYKNAKMEKLQALEEEKKKKEQEEEEEENNATGGVESDMAKIDVSDSDKEEEKTDQEEKALAKDGEIVPAETKEEKPLKLLHPSDCELLLFSPCPRAVAVLASYPRSGNSLMRNLYERVTLRVSGSDMRGGLQKHDLVGEAATQTNCVQFVKTHYPERMGQPPMNVDRAVLVVRNPYDAMESYWNLMTTNTHNTSMSTEERKKYQKLFAGMARKEILVWRDFHEWWLQQKIPILVIRYEDLIRYTDEVISKVIKFVLEVKDMDFFEKRIDRFIRQESVENIGAYRPRSGGIGKSLTKGVYTPQLLQEINIGIIATMEKFGYTEMLVPNPSDWKLEPLDQLGVLIPGTAKEPMVINKQGLVRGPKRMTNWMAVKKQIDADRKHEEDKKKKEEEKADGNEEKKE
eukprot:CAMPEP_0113443282 /NCGR_PEP_ID=MMETSP0014_2-20120614/2054_1 /TAXON_ID=2857 /ORGANISM="Nitzschia sp." /LENGTH=674 /DNA_ID=CAMNT_0000334225 /DNA_START=24 /DNA_END=2048 /DNA_ORIENTATION=+ /assembly_acc=CAM_ASM_000159